MHANETVKSKLTFEREAQIKGVAIKGYYNDNGIFNASDFMEDLSKKDQMISFSGFGNSHKNGLAECAIKKSVTTERTMLMYAAL